MRVFLCQSCDKPKAALKSVKSTVIDGVDVIMCQTCIENKYEPRFMIVLSVQTVGMTDKAKKLILERKYVGKFIEAAEIV